MENELGVLAPLPMPVPEKTSLDEHGKSLLNLAMSVDHGTPMFKIRHFVGDAQITHYAKYKQLLLETRSREELIEQTLVTLAKNKARVEECREQIELTESPATKKMLHWELTSIANDVAKTERRLHLMYSERDMYIKAIQEMYDNGTAYLPDGTDLREAMVPGELADALEAEHWTYRLGKQAALDLITYGHIGTGNMEAISMMNESQAYKTLELAMTYSHGLKQALGTMEASIIDAIESGKFKSTTKIENLETKKELEG